MTKLCELQQADLERYKQAYEASRPNHPERAPRDQLQLAFERVLQTLGAAAPANDGHADGDETEAAGGGTAGALPERSGVTLTDGVTSI
jgi:hypothetical protein